MLRRSIGVLFLAIAGSLLAACGGGTAQTSTNNGAETTVSGSSSALMSIDSDLYGSQDLSLVANSGKPQFIHSFADW